MVQAWAKTSSPGSPASVAPTPSTWWSAAHSASSCWRYCSTPSSTCWADSLLRGVSVTDKATKEQSAQATKTMINLENLTKVFPGQEQPAVEDLSMEIYEGEIVVFVGPSGCGKTTTIDRKSTRLNSSHANISYAVFCLKKKNTAKVSEIQLV